ncbi:MAG: glycosyltransferase family 39 protein [Anaerolineae bacterium]|nr:glycosyltransferase family 39 protein [Anaerolineae bacterium]
MSRRTTALLLASGLGLLLLGQAYFLWRPLYVWDGVIFCGLGVLLWLLAWRRSGEPAPHPSLRLARLRQWLAGAAAHPIQTALLGTGILLVLWAGIGARRADSAADFSPYLRAWAFGLLLYLLAFVPLHPLRRQVQSTADDRSRLPASLPLALLLLSAFLIRAVALDTVPANFGGDEGTQALEALRLLGPPMGNPFATGWYDVPTMSFLVAGLWMQLFGATVAGARALSALVGTASVLATWLLARRLAGAWVAWGAAALVAFGHYGLHFSRLASSQIADALLAPLSLYFLLRGLESKDGRHLDLALAGVVLGLSWYTYFGARLMTVVVGLYLLGRALAGKDAFLAWHGRGLLALMAGFALTLWPLALYYIAHPADFLSRYNQVNIFASGWLAREMELTGKSAATLLLEQFWKSVSAFNITPDPTFWYRPGIPLLDPVSGVFFILGLAVAFWRARRPGEGLLLLWFWAFILLGWTLTENPPSSQRGVGSIPVVAILAALGLTETLQAVRLRFTPRVSLYALLLILMALINLNFYFRIYTPRRIYGNPTAEVADVLCDALERRGSVPPVYLDGAPFMYWDFGAIAFRLRGVAGQDFSVEELPQVDPSNGALFVVLAEKMADLDLLRDAFPNGVETSYHSDVNGRLLFVTYEVPPSRHGGP